MKTVNFLYGRTTFDLEVPDDTPVLTSNVDALKSDKDGYEIVKEAMDTLSTAHICTNLPRANLTVQSLSVTTHVLFRVRISCLI